MYGLFELFEEETDYLEVACDFIEPDPEAYIARHRHTLRFGRMHDDPDQWFIKEVDGPVTAKSEVVAQEFFRLISEEQPETRRLIDGRNVNHICSKKIEGFHSLIPRKREDSKWPYEYPRLGEIMLSALFLQETDLKPGNIGLDRENQIIKVDGDHCFSNLKNEAPPFGPITLETLSYFPFPVGFSPFNWINLYKKGEQCVKHPSIQDIEVIQHKTSFGFEMNQAILKICLLPEALLVGFVDAYIPGGDSRLNEILLQRSKELQSSAFQYTAFRKFLCASEAIDTIKNHIEHLLDFIVNGKNYLIRIEVQPKMHVQLIHSAFQLYKFVLMDLSFEKEQMVGRLFEMADMGASDEDKVLANGLLETLQQVLAAKDLCALERVENRINGIERAVFSEEYSAVKERIQHLRESASCLSFKKREKATRVEQELCDTPICKRERIVSGPVNGVQKALAWHRHPCRSKNVFFERKPDEIDPEKAANSFRQLHKEFKEEGRLLVPL